MILSENTKFLIPYIGTALIFSGALKIITFYSLFNFNITPYLELQEILSLFLLDIMTYSITAIASFILVFFLKKYNRDTQNSNSKLRLFRTTKKATVRIKLLFSEQFIFYWLIINIGSGPIVYFFFREHFTFYLHLLAMCLAFCIFLIIVIELLSGLKERRIKISLTALALGFFFSILNILNIIHTSLEYSNIKNEKSTFGTSIYLENKILVSDSTKYYIGKTKNFVLFYNEASKMTEVYPVSEIKRLTISTHKR